MLNKLLSLTPTTALLLFLSFSGPTSKISSQSGLKRQLTTVNPFTILY